ncbi:hypothetical protein SBOR_5534 [Sclerotinia borealis F-4128]|uniref:Uncharacterized protein n=1 Tax=Sclerotinia borealis (strain F-4128) TaxID=1432307 RepID=W9CDY5_SCLBF|nr:hypothetical protein SBOR_5534 [Sclerotinia borealis F-4128]
MVLVALVTGGIGGGIAEETKGEKDKGSDSKHSTSQSSPGLTNTTSPCQSDPYTNDTIVQAIPGKDMVSTNFKLFCNRTFDVESSKHLMSLAIPDTEWCKLFSASGWGTDEAGADCAVNLAPVMGPSIIAGGISSMPTSATSISIPNTMLIGPPSKYQTKALTRTSTEDTGGVVFVLYSFTSQVISGSTVVLATTFPTS